MCGIICKICFFNASAVQQDAKILKRIRNRGPNHTQSLEISLEDGTTANFCGAVLWMQGLQLVPQPAKHDQGVLLYNGDIFDETWDSNISDTQRILQKLSYDVGQCSESHIIGQLKLLKGPFALIYYDKMNNNLYFTRDRIGRTSLLFHKTDDTIIISSVLGREFDCVEIPATHIQVMNIVTKKLKLYKWTNILESPEEFTLDDWLTQLRVQQSIPDDEFEFDFDEEDLLDEDNVISHIESSKQLKCKLSILKNILEHPVVKEHVLKIVELLEKSVELRLKRQPMKCKECIGDEINYCNHCTVGVLFSGGLDCTILALLADKFLPKEQSIDLINVAFRKDDKASYDVPDRLTGKLSLLELEALCPTRQWVLKEVNVPKQELDKHQAETIGDLVYPRQTILDESLGTALWFAARGQDDRSISTSRVLLVGSGADELFGGYVRHRNAFRRNGWQGLSKELQLDWKRISFRNLARDNRVICDHGRQPRMPYLDEDFTKYVLSLKPWLRCFPSEELGVGVGDKLMLRLVALSLGLSDAVLLPKRALQFGSRIANKKEKGSDVSKTFLKNKV
ncbi:unnamed protein product [Arctia plantaginis]|uniref:Asparagine synthetase domain-containing protein 1 n=1 Tax=Arctia plantaginis TaxID=874455 RepID=A0A8S0ZDH4_ARCPL|nr:unnamed protein product [Arctia plantaginis]